MFSEFLGSVFAVGEPGVKETGLYLAVTDLPGFFLLQPCAWMLDWSTEIILTLQITSVVDSVLKLKIFFYFKSNAWICFFMKSRYERIYVYKIYKQSFLLFNIVIWKWSGKLNTASLNHCAMKDLCSKFLITNVGFGNLKFAGWFVQPYLQAIEKWRKNTQSANSSFSFLYCNYNLDFFRLCEVHLPFDVKKTFFTLLPFIVKTILVPFCYWVKPIKHCFTQHLSDPLTTTAIVVVLTSTHFIQRGSV